MLNAKVISLCAGLAVSLAAPFAASAEDAIAQPGQKTIGQPQSAKGDMIPSLAVINSRGATLQGNVLTMTDVGSNSIVFADRPFSVKDKLKRQETQASPRIVGHQAGRCRNTVATIAATRRGRKTARKAGGPGQKILRQDAAAGRRRRNRSIDRRARARSCCTYTFRRPKVPASVANIDLDRVRRALFKADGNVTRAAKSLKVRSADLRRLTWRHPKLIMDALEHAHRLVDKAEENLLKALGRRPCGSGVAGEPVHFVAQRRGSRAWLEPPCRFRL